MIVKGTLKEFGEGFRRDNDKNYKYDYIVIGTHRIKKIQVPSFLEPKLRDLVGSEIEVSFYKGLLLLPKVILAIKTKNNDVIREELNVTTNFLKYTFVTGLLLSPLYAIIWYILLENIVIIIVFHLILSYVTIKPFINAYNAFGKETSGYKDI